MTIFSVFENEKLYALFNIIYVIVTTIVCTNYLKRTNYFSLDADIYYINEYYGLINYYSYYKECYMFLFIFVVWVFEKRVH